MNWSIKEVVKVLLVIAVLAGGTLCGTSDVWALENGSTFAQQIQGSWVLVSIVNEQDGKKFDVFGPNPRGVLILTPDGRVVNIIMRATLPKIAANNRVKGTAEETQAILEGTIATFGTYKVVSDNEYNVIMHVEGSTFPNWDGQDQKRIYTVIGDELKIINPTPAIGGGKNYQVWKRAK